MSSLTIYFKSGNCVLADRVKEWSVKYQGNEVVGLTVVQRTKGLFQCKNKLVVGAMALDQIEAIVEH